MEALKQDIQHILESMHAESSLGSVMNAFLAALRNHPEALGALEGSYRLTAVDTGFDTAFRLSADGLVMLSADEKAGAVISGREADLLAILRRELSPMTAMFTGKLTVKGSKQSLMKFAQIL